MAHCLISDVSLLSLRLLLLDVMSEDEKNLLKNRKVLILLCVLNNRKGLLLLRVQVNCGRDE